MRARNGFREEEKRSLRISILGYIISLEATGE